MPAQGPGEEREVAEALGLSPGLSGSSSLPRGVPQLQPNASPRPHGKANPLPRQAPGPRVGGRAASLSVISASSLLKQPWPPVLAHPNLSLSILLRLWPDPWETPQGSTDPATHLVWRNASHLS